MSHDLFGQPSSPPDKDSTLTERSSSMNSPLNNSGLTNTNTERTDGSENSPSFGNPGLIGQTGVKDQISKLLQSDRLSHAYLFIGPKGSGKTAFALAMAEWINGVEHLSKLGPHKRSAKATWAAHPDIHLFFPVPVSATDHDRTERLGLLKKDPYEIIDYALRPSVTGASGSKNQRAFYSIQYFRETIRPVTVLKPNEGKRTVVILTSIDTMRAETANAFLKLLEEPSGHVLFILTAESSDALLPTIRSRCQLIRFQPLTTEEVTDALVSRDGFTEQDAAYLARLSDGFYALAKFQDMEQLKQSRAQLIDFLRASYTQDATALLGLIHDWNTAFNLEAQISLLNGLELTLRDILITRETKSPALIIHQEQWEVIQKIALTLKDAQLEEMILHVSELKALLFQNVQFKLILSVMSLRFFPLMRGKDPSFSPQEGWKHLPAFVPGS